MSESNERVESRTFLHVRARGKRIVVELSSSDPKDCLQIVSELGT